MNKELVVKTPKEKKKKVFLNATHCQHTKKKKQKSNIFLTITFYQYFTKYFPLCECTNKATLRRLIASY